MQSMILCAILFAQSSSVNSENTNAIFGNAYVLPAVVVTASRTPDADNSIFGNAYVLPATIVTAKREPADGLRYSSQPRSVIAAAFEYIARAFRNLLPKYAYALDTETDTGGIRINLRHNSALVKTTDTGGIQINLSPDKQKSLTSGDYYVDTNETIEDDVSINGTATIDGTIEGDLTVLGGEATVNGSVEGEVAVLGGNLRINGTIDKDAAVFGGTVRHKGKIKGDLAAIGGSVILDSGSIIEGDIVTIGGTVEKDSNAIVQGEIESMDLPLDQYVPKLSRFFRFHRPEGIGPAIVTRMLSLGLIVMFYVLCLLALLLFPAAVDKVNAKLLNDFWVSVAIGVAILLAIIPAIVLFAITIIGIPLILLLPFALGLAGIFGFASLSLVIGKRICESAKWAVKNQIGIFSIGWLALMAILIIAGAIHFPLITIVGMAIFWSAWIIGQGAVLYAILKQDKKKESK